MTAAGFYHCSVKSVGRANGRSVVAAAAYRAGERLTDASTGQVQDYQLRRGVLDTFILAGDGAPAWAHDREALWNAAERAELRSNGRLATELELALPHELSDAQRKQLLTEYLRPIIAQHGVAADVAVHAPGQGRDHRNVHAHVLLTHRELGTDGFGDIANERTIIKRAQGQERETRIAGLAATPADIRAIRQGWEQAINRAYERADLDIRTDHRSHEERGLEAEPTKHLGPTAAAMERRGAESERGVANREITQRNSGRRELATLETEARAIGAEIIDLQAERAKRAAREDAPIATDAAPEARERPGARADREAQVETGGPPKEMRPLGKAAGDIRTAWTLSRTAGELDEALAARGIALAQVSPEEARQSERTAAFANEVGNSARVLKEGEIVAVNAHGDVHRLDRRTTGDLSSEIEARLAGVDRSGLLSVTDARDVMREAAHAAWRDEAREWRDANTRPTGIETRIADALANTMTGIEFAAALDVAGLTITRTTAADVLALDALRHEAGLAAIVAHTTDTNIDRDARHFGHVTEGDYAAVTRGGDVFRLNPTALDFEEAEQRLADTQPRLPSIVEARALNEVNRENAARDRATMRTENMEAHAARDDAFEGDRALHRTVAAAEQAVEGTLDAAGDALNAASRTEGKILGGFAKAVENVLGGIFEFFAGGPPKLTPMQAELAARAAEERAEARAWTDAVQEKEAAQDWNILAEHRRRQQEEEDRKTGRSDEGRERERERDRY